MAQIPTFRSRVVRAGIALALVVAPLTVEATTDHAAARTQAAISSLSGRDRDDLQQAVNAQLAAGKGGRQTAQNEITYPDGAVVVLPLPGSDVAPRWSGDHRDLRITTDPDWHNCPTPSGSEPSYYCFYSEKDWGGRRLQFNFAHEDKPVDFNDYGFRKQTSAWVNTTSGLAIVVDKDAGSGKWMLLWREEPQSMSRTVAQDKAADRFWAVRA
ncbi:peptidase inhibitor family I36 protein [Kitasatospora sp. NPDC056076]|uniref:peptidase inhibitor family I36 protein n=1 Tax=Kitasatospora sp. NPDC056076 TaxID=3345703 RepID=UPI0035DFFC07